VISSFPQKVKIISRFGAAVIAIPITAAYAGLLLKGYNGIVALVCSDL